MLSDPIKVGPVQISTFVTEPSASLALAVIVIDAGAVYTAPAAGAVSDTRGA